MIQAYCICGKRVVINEELAGQDINCIRCGRSVPLPTVKPKPEPASVETSAVVGEQPPAANGSIREHIYWIIALLLFPLAVYLGRPETATFTEQLQRTLDHSSPDVQREARQVWQEIMEGEARLDDLFAVLPNQRLHGAALPRHTAAHLLFALGTAAVFWVIVSLCFAVGSAQPGDLIMVGLFTGIFGIGLLLILHFWGPTATFIRLCFLADRTHRPDLFQTWAVYTFGVGLFEEGVKLIPLLWYLFKHRRISWRLACLWGLASGAGFGISEGVSYSAQMYNGIAGMEIYLVRFASCVALHAMWTASAGISLYHCQDMIRAMRRWDVDDVNASIAFTPDRPLYTYQNQRPSDFFGWIVVILRVIFIVMFLHGLYDAALVRRYYPLALAVAVVSFTWLACQIEAVRQKNKQPPPEPESPKIEAALGG